MGGAVAAIDYMKEALIKSNASRVEAIEKGEQILVGVNAYTETESSPLSASGDGILTVSEAVELEQIANLNAWRQRRDDKAVRDTLVKVLNDPEIAITWIDKAKPSVPSPLTPAVMKPTRSPSEALDGSWAAASAAAAAGMAFPCDGGWVMTAPTWPGPPPPAPGRNDLHP